MVLNILFRYHILCKTCEKIICNSDDIRKDGSHYCAIRDIDSEHGNIWNNLGINVAVKKVRFFDSAKNIHIRVLSLLTTNTKSWDQSFVLAN